MRKLIVLAVTLVCSSLWAVAQTSYPAGQTAGPPGSSASSGAATMTVDGCLSGSEGNFILKDKTSGATYNLVGQTSKLSDHVGHEVQVTGTASSASSDMNSSASSTATGASGTAGQNTLRVASIKHVASSCTSGQ